MPPTLESAIAAFGSAARQKLSNPAAYGQPEDQLRNPFEQLLQDLAQLCNFAPGTVVSVGESSVSDLKTRPDFAVTVHGALVGFVELKAPGKGADPRKFKDPHDKAQWQKLSSLPNLIYSDGNAFWLYQTAKRPVEPFISTATSKYRGRIYRRRPRCSGFSRAFSSGSRFLLATRANSRRLPRACAGSCAMK